MTRALPADTQMDLKAMIMRGTPVPTISKALGISKGVISKYNKKWFPNRARVPGGRPAIVTDASKALVRRKVLNGTLKTAADAHKELSLLGYDLTAKTAANILKSMNFFSSVKKK